MKSGMNAAIWMTIAPAMVALLIAPAIALPSPAFAASYHVSSEASCKALPLSGGNATWASSTHWCTIPAGSTLTLSGNYTLAIDSGVMLINEGAIQNGGGATITIASGAMIHNIGTFDNTGKVEGSGIILNIGVLNNAATIALSSPGGIENTKTGILANSAFVNTGFLTNAGTLINSGIINSKTHVENTGTIINSGDRKSVV